MVETYFLSHNGVESGPFTASQVQGMWRAGKVTIETMFWTEGQAEWLPLSTVLDELEPVAHRRPPSLPQAKTATTSAEQHLWSGHPSMLTYFWSWVFGIIFLAAYGGGLIIILWIFLSRASNRYLVTTRKVMLQTGLFIKSSTEIRICDIRSVNISKRGLSGLFGIGSVEFSSAASDRAEVIFSGVSNPESVRNLVRGAQG